MNCEAKTHETKHFQCPEVLSIFCDHNPSFPPKVIAVLTLLIMIPWLFFIVLPSLYASLSNRLSSACLFKSFYQLRLASFAQHSVCGIHPRYCKWLWFSLIPSKSGRHLGCFQLGAIKNNACLNTLVYTLIHRKYIHIYLQGIFPQWHFFTHQQGMWIFDLSSQ